MDMNEYLYEPTNEQGVVAILTEFLDRHDFNLVSIQTQFPDAQIQDRETGKTYFAELEFYSSSFIIHRHNPTACDILICWEHNALDRGIPLPICVMKDDVFYLQANYDDKDKEIWFLRLENAKLQNQLDKVDNNLLQADWRKLRPTLSDEDLYNIAYLSPSDIKVTASKFGVTERTVENWRGYAREELGVD